MTDKPTPTDAELKTMWQLHAADIGGIFYYARAVLAKWGQTAHSGEPVAWKHDCAALLTNDVELWIDACPHCGKPRNAPQPVERVPLTQAKVVEAFCALPHQVQFITAFDQGVRFAELHHGIKGGQQ